MARVYALLLLCLLSLGAMAQNATPAADDAAIEARMLRITEELRCLVCQNETIAGSNASLAEDLRQQVRAMLRKGESDEQIIKYMTDRYGDFVLYRPPLKGTTLLLWFGPGVLLVGGLAVLILVLRHRARMSDDRVEPIQFFNVQKKCSMVRLERGRSGTTARPLRLCCRRGCESSSLRHAPHSVR